MPTIYRNYLGIEPIDTGNTFTLVIVDSSSYINYPENPALEITPPGYSDFFQVPFKASLVNSYNSSTIGLNVVFETNGLVRLPDGIWKLRYKICPYEQSFVDRYYMRTNLLDEKIKQIYNNINLRACENNTIDYLKNQVFQIEILRAGAKAVVEINEQKAWGDYQAASKLADQILERHCNHCQIR